MPPWVSNISMIITLALSVGNLCVMGMALKTFINRPNKTQDDRLNEHDQKFDDVYRKFEKIENKLDNDRVHLNALDESTSITQGALLAIMDSLMAIVPDESKHELQKKRKDLYDYLTEK